MWWAPSFALGCLLIGVNQGLGAINYIATNALFTWAGCQFTAMSALVVEFSSVAGRMDKSAAGETGISTVNADIAQFTIQKAAPAGRHRHSMNWFGLVPITVSTTHHVVFFHATCRNSYPAISKSAGRSSPADSRRIISSDRGRTRLSTSATRAREPM